MFDIYTLIFVATAVLIFARVVVMLRKKSKPSSTHPTGDNTAVVRKPLKSDAAHVFVSFAHQDRSAALNILEHLEQAGIRCWISARDVPRGGDFQDAIVDALESAIAMVLVFSQSADNSTEVRKEVALASQTGVFVLPVRIEKIEPTRGFKYQFVTRNFVDLFEDRDQNIKVMIDTLRGHQTKRSSSQKAMTFPTPPNGLSP